MANRRPLRGAFLIPPPQGAVADLNVDNTDRVERFLADHPGRFYCNRCLSEALLSVSLPQVCKVTKTLQSVLPYRHGKMLCAQCRVDRGCIAYGQEPPLPDSVEPVQHP